MEDIVKKIVQYIATHSECESILLTPMPQWSVGSHQLLEYIETVSGTSTELMTAWVEEARKTI